MPFFTIVTHEILDKEECSSEIGTIYRTYEAPDAKQVPITLMRELRAHPNTSVTIHESETWTLPPFYQSWSDGTHGMIEAFDSFKKFEEWTLNKEMSEYRKRCMKFDQAQKAMD